MSESNNGHIVLNGFKGIWTLDEVVNLLQSNGLKIKISFPAKEGRREMNGKPSNLAEKGA